MAETLPLESLHEPLRQVGHLARFTVSDVVRLGEAGVLRDDRRYELLNGLLHEMHAPGPNHQYLVNKITFLFTRLFIERGIDPEQLVMQEKPLYFSASTYRLPDVMVLSAPPLERGRPRLVRPADVELVVEVSLSTYKTDAGEKLRRYARGGIPEYWVVRVEAEDWTDRVLEVRRRPVDEDYAEVAVLGYGEASLVLEGASLRRLGPLRVDDILG